MNLKMDKYLSYLIGIQFVLTASQYVIQMFIPVDSSLRLLISLVFNGVLAVLIMLVFKYVLERNLFFILMTYIIAIMFLLINILFFPQNKMFIQDIQLELLLSGLISFVYVYAIKDYSTLIKSLYISGFLVAIISIIIYFLKIFILGDSSYSIYFSYLVIFAVIINLDKFLYTKKGFLTALLIIFNIGIVLHVGSRGAILCLITYLILSLIFRSNYKVTSKVLISLFLISAYTFYKEILIGLNELLSLFGIYSRTLTSLTRENIYLSGREFIYENTINAINENLLTGIGLAGDRLINNGTYSHNIVLELLATFGIFIGSLLLLILLFLFIRACIFNKDPNGKVLCIIYFSYAIPMLMVSRTLWTQTEFWILLALCLNAGRLNKIKSKRLNT